MMKQRLFGIALLVLAGCGFVIAHDEQKKVDTDIVIFSYNRPMQLYALLESIDHYVSGFNETHIVYRSDSEQFDCGYEQVLDAFPLVHAHKQGANPVQDFKPLTMMATFGSPSSYVLFAVDDIIVKDHVDLSECIDALEKTNGYGFYLRLGKNLNYCYSMNARQPLPQFQELDHGICAWEIKNGVYDWKYPNTVDMTLYKKEEIYHDFRTMSFFQPNKLEASWAARGPRIFHRYGLCYQTTKMVNLPLNRVQNFWLNRTMNSYSPEELLDIFLSGKKIDIYDLHQVDNKAAHMEYEPIFIER